MQKVVTSAIGKSKRTGQSMGAAEIEFITYCIGNLSERLGLSQRTVYHLLEESGILYDYIVPSYDVLHTFGKDYLMDDLISYMQKKELFA